MAYVHAICSMSLGFMQMTQCMEDQQGVL